jgi:hypothetical protein
MIAHNLAEFPCSSGISVRYLLLQVRTAERRSLVDGRMMP